MCRTGNELPVSANAHGDIVTCGISEYRWRNGQFYKREGEGDLNKCEWEGMPRQVRDVFIEKTF